MPVRSLNSVVLKWPRATEVIAAFTRWAQALAKHHPTVQMVGYMGSYARGNWGVGSDLDAVVVIDHPKIRSSNGPSLGVQIQRFDRKAIPVPVDLQIFDEDDWRRLLQSDTRFARTLKKRVEGGLPTRIPALIR